MGKAFKIVENEDKDIKKSKYPDLPFVVKDEYDNKYLVFYDDNNNKYYYLDLEDGKSGYRGYDSLEDMFNDNDLYIILETELVIKGRYN